MIGDDEALGCQRGAFSLPRDVHYLNCAYMGPLPIEAQESGLAAIRRKAVPTTIEPADFFRESDEARALFASIVGATDPSRVAILPAVSYGVAIAVRNLPCGAGANIVTATEQFPSNVYAWRRLARERGAELRAIAPPVSAPPRAAAWTEAILAAIDGGTAIVALPHVHWTDGTRFDLEHIADAARDVGAALVIDGTQSIGAMPFDLDRIRPDAVLCAAYKWLLGPYSVAFGWFGPRFDDGVPLEETWIARRGSENFKELVNYRDEYQPGAARYDVGERSNFLLMPMAVAALRLVRDWGAHRIQRYLDGLFGPVLEEAAGLGYAVEPRTGRGAHLFGIRVPAAMPLEALDGALRRRSIFASLRGSALRVAPYLYNDSTDAEALREALREAAGGETRTGLTA